MSRLTAPSTPTEIARSLTAAERADLTRNWDAFCDCDWQDMTCEPDGYAERMEAAGYAELVPVDADALDDPFAAERGICPGGMMWRLTPLGEAVRDALAREGAES